MLWEIDEHGDMEYDSDRKYRLESFQLFLLNSSRFHGMYCSRPLVKHDEAKQIHLSATQPVQVRKHWLEAWQSESIVIQGNLNGLIYGFTSLIGPTRRTLNTRSIHHLISLEELNCILSLP